VKEVIRILLRIILIIVSLENLEAQAQDARIEISLSKATYFEYEAVWLDVALTNTGKDTIRIMGIGLPSGWGFRLEIKDEKGNILKYTGPEYDYAPGPGYLLNPGDSYYECFNLPECFGELRSLEDFFLPTLKIGNYIAKGEYWLGRDFKISSKEIRFEVKSPMGIEKKPYQLLKKAREYRFAKEHDLKNVLRELLVSYPKSVYAELASKELLDREAFLDKFPNSGFNQTTLRVLTEKMAKEKKAEKKQEFLQKTIKNHPGTRSAKFAQKILRGW
jgi:hypothetical protein